MDLYLPTDEQRANLEKLAVYLENMDPDYARTHFLMASYMACIPDFEDQFYEDEPLRFSYEEAWDVEEQPNMILLVKDQAPNSQYSCGTCACAVGHGPAAGIPVGEAKYWTDYQREAFGVSSSYKDPTYTAWRYMFGPDNEDDPYEAAGRIRDVLNGDKKWLAFV